MPRVWLVGGGYGFSAPLAPLYSLREYAWAPEWATVMGLMFGAVLARAVAGWAMAMLLLELSQRVKNVLYAALAGSALLCIPPLLSSYGLDWAKWFSAYPLFHFGAMMTRADTAAAAFLFLFGWFAMGWLCRCDLRDRWV